MGKLFHITEPKLECFEEGEERVKLKAFIINNLELFQFGLLRAFNRLESLFIRPPAPKDGWFCSRVGVGPRVNLDDGKKTGSCFGNPGLYDGPERHGAGR